MNIVYKLSLLPKKKKKTPRMNESLNFTANFKLQLHAKLDSILITYCKLKRFRIFYNFNAI